MVTCSRDKDSDLFFAVLGGLGQFGIITRARIGLMPAPKRVRWVRLAYSDVATFTKDQELLISKRASEAGFDYVEGQVQLNRTLTEGPKSTPFFSSSDIGRLAGLASKSVSGVIYVIEGAMYYNESTSITMDQKLESILGQLSFEEGLVFTKDVRYVQFLDRVREEERVLRSIGMWDVPHPWLNLFVPRSRILDFDAGVFKGVFAGANPVGVILMYPMNTNMWDDRMMAVASDDDVFYAVGLLRSAAVIGDVERLEKENEAVLAFCNNEDIGCKQYLPHYTSQDGWQRHFGAKWSRVADLKAKYDPQRILSPGQRIFSSPASMVVASIGSRWLHEKTAAAVGSAGRWHRIVAPREGSGTAGSTTTKRHWVADNEDFWDGGGEDFGMGIGDLGVARAFRHGPQIANVLELDVITGRGDMVTCSRDKGPDLFFAVLGGLGQFGIITRARIGLEPAPKRVRWVRLAYSDVVTFTRDQELLISKRASEAGFDYDKSSSIGQVQLNRTLTEGPKSTPFFSRFDIDRLVRLASESVSGVIYFIEGAMYYNESTAASVDQKLTSVLEQLSFDKGFVFTKDVSYVQFLDRVREEERILRSIGMWDVPHPWLNLFVPQSRILDFDTGVLKGVFAGANPVGVILMYPMNRNMWDDRMTAVSGNDDMFYVVGLLRSAVVPGDVERMERENEAVLAFCDNEGIGCKQYLPHYASQDGWRSHFGAKWSRVTELKVKYDPYGILSPGQRIFSSLTPMALAAMMKAYGSLCEAVWPTTFCPLHMDTDRWGHGALTMDDDALIKSP
uniref:Cytokinin dehydrogenase 1 FAD/cytokinin binding domain-containing protein n=1 Tax=Oryza glumipatula TaxID=40148 RepID=A0A0D9YPE5_9ORYZ